MTGGAATSEGKFLGAKSGRKDSAGVPAISSVFGGPGLCGASAPQAGAVRMRDSSAVVPIVDNGAVGIGWIGRDGEDCQVCGSSFSLGSEVGALLSEVGDARVAVVS